MKSGIATALEEPHTVDAADHLRVLLECSNDAVIVSSLEGLVSGWNPAAQLLFGHTAEDMAGRPLGLLSTAERQDEVELILDAIRNGQRVEKFQTERLHRCGKAIPVSLTVAAIHASDGTLIGTSTIVRDLTHEQHAQNKLWEEQFLDGLTRLPNRRLFNDKLHVALGREDLESAPLALLLVNIDRFQEVNEALGGTYGDHLLIQAGSRIRACSGAAAGGRPGAVVARLSGDEFALLLPDMDGGPQPQETAARLLESLREPFRIAEHEVTVSARIGIALGPRDGITPEELRLHAEMAVREARRLGGDRWQEFTEDLRRAASRRARLQTELRQALELQQFELHYQPILSLRDGSLRRCEALLRWCHPELGMVSPAEFIPLAEESGLIRQIGDWVFCTALAQAVSWRQRLRADIQIAVNLSPVQLAMAHSREIDQWAQLVRASGLPSGAISCEITEGVAVELSGETARRLRRLREAGIEVAVDDFGLGYFSFRSLKQLEINRLKIDKSLIQDLDSDHGTLEACRGLVLMAHGMGWTVVAEGVETERQRSLAEEIGCDYLQGYLVCRPGHPAAIEPLLAGA